MNNKTRIKTKMLDDKEYWKNRHSSRADLTASGIKSVGVRSNEYIYKILAEQYSKLLERTGIKDVRSVLDCGFGDGYFLRFYKLNYPEQKIFGVDISPQAKKKIDFLPKQNLYISDLAKFKPGRRFDIVHSFDVLYHILSDEDYIQALQNMANLSDKYIILHERFLKRTPLFSSRHVYMRSGDYTTQILNSQNFFLSKEIPTHFFAMRVPLYKLNKIMPKLLYGIDKYIANNAHPSTQGFLGSHFIRIYEKR